MLLAQLLLLCGAINASQQFDGNVIPGYTYYSSMGDKKKILYNGGNYSEWNKQLMGEVYGFNGKNFLESDFTVANYAADKLELKVDPVWKWCSFSPFGEKLSQKFTNPPITLCLAHRGIKQTGRHPVEIKTEQFQLQNFTQYPDKVEEPQIMHFTDIG